MKLFVKETTTVLKWIIPLYLILLWLPYSTTDCSQQSGKACKDCIEVSGCVYCEPTKQCLNGSIVKNTLNKHCEGQEWKAGQCIVSGKVLIIALSVAGIVVLVTVFCCIYCCCCRRKRGNGKPDKEEAKFRREREERSKRHEDREQERREKREEIRKKYGLNQQPV
ncbi:PREDICTED: pituitary tumor-transforming gene 1 protein-interacting protein-like isoform X7 [Acropora digitifera]|uniref:pituitary tumor-transforming gene 1 protein-interacting protein-like isoform X7 n=1 Tax=Acropora digitifera TaxID=70779 RepID=UPI00077B08AB|nr:PREDICTED: pituitary tumor-transforming gene 1 protein-interacting protein-like isoform X7 [Acropora digitifera]